MESRRQHSHATKKEAAQTQNTVLLYRLLAENMRDMVCLHDLNGVYEYVSPSCESLIGYQPAELVGKSLFDFIHDEEIVCVREDMQQPLLNGAADLTIEYRMRQKSGDYIWVETIAQRLAETDGKAVRMLTVSRDISKRKAAERERQTAQEEIAKVYFSEQSARAEAETAHREADIANRAKDEFLQLISHEFRTPLTTIKTLSRILQQGGETAAERHEYLETIVAECDRQIDMILNLLDVARIEEGSVDLRREPVNVNRVLRVCEKIERHAAIARNQIFTVETDESLPTALGDEKALRRALCSIIENAIKYTPVGGRVNLSVEQVTRIVKRADRNAMTVGAELASGATGKNHESRETIIEEIAIRISDTGRGIHPEDLPLLFQKFFRGRKTVPHDHTTDGTPDDAMGRAETPGVGLGLYLSKRLIAELGGRIEVQSEVGRGSTFTIYLNVWSDEKNQLDTTDEYGFDEGAIT